MGNPFAHIELNTSDTKAAKAFYKKLFDWKLTDMNMGRDMVYTMLDVGKGVGGGMQKQMMPGAPSQWLSYVEVDDVDKSIAKAQKLGAKILVPHMDIGENGSLGVFLDPTGATLGVWSEKKAEKKEKKDKKKDKKDKKDKK